MHLPVSKIVLFTLTACPTGRNMGTVLREVIAAHPSIEFRTIYVEIDTETTNRYKIKTNPSILFLDGDENELYRLEGFQETKQINHIINELNEKRLVSTGLIEGNQPTIENYTIYLLKNGEPTSIDIQHKNETSIKAPRITVINILLEANFAGYDNPFPANSKLERIEFAGSLAKVTIDTQSSISTKVVERMEILLIKTLASFGINEIILSFSPNNNMNLNGCN